MGGKFITISVVATTSLSYLKSYNLSMMKDFFIETKQGKLGSLWNPLLTKKKKLFVDPNPTDQTKYFTDTLISIANECIRKTSTSNKHKTPSFNDYCRKAIRQSKAALRKFYKQPTITNLNDFKLLRAKTRKLIKEAKKKSWQNYVNLLGSSTKTNTIRRMIRKISGKPQSTTIKHLKKSNGSNYKKRQSRSTC